MVRSVTVNIQLPKRDTLYLYGFFQINLGTFGVRCRRLQGSARSRAMIKSFTPMQIGAALGSGSGPPRSLRRQVPQAAGNDAF